MMIESRRRITPLELLAAMLLPAAGCTLSESSKSTSKIISSPFQSSSASSRWSEGGYQKDVRDFTAAYYKSNGRPEDLRLKISELAGKHGVSDWQENESTFRGIGEGLGKAGARQVEVDAFKTNLTENKQQADWMQDGYESTAK